MRAACAEMALGHFSLSLYKFVISDHEIRFIYEMVA
jgi:hypothetical protein